MNQKTKNIIKVIWAAALLLGVFYFFSGISARYSFNSNYADSNAKFSAFEKEEKDSLDAVVLGTSVMRAWLPTCAYDGYGIKAFGLMTDAQPFGATQAILESVVLKNQSPKLVIIDVGAAQKEVSEVEGLHLRYIADGLTFSHKVEFLTKTLPVYWNAAKVGNSDPFSYFFPFLYEHNYYGKLADEKDVFEAYDNPYKGYFVNPVLTVVKFDKPDISSIRPIQIGREPRKVLDDLLDFCDQHPEIEFLFTINPKVGTIDGLSLGFDFETETAHNMWVTNYLTNRGFTVLDFTSDELLKAVGIDFKKDFKDERHLNIYGSVKYTDYLCRYIAEHYDLPGKDAKRDPTWDKAAADFNAWMDRQKVDRSVFSKKSVSS